MYGTRTDPNSTGGWIITDPVVRLRELDGRERVHSLPATPTELTIGSAQGCGLRLDNAQVSRKHAMLRPYKGGWKLHDLRSKNGLWRNGHRRLSFALCPGDEIGIGGLRLMAESPQLIALRELLCRYIGWRSSHGRIVDDALRSLSDWAARRCTLMLRGEGDLTTVAHRLHTATLGAVDLISEEECARATHGTLWVRKLPSDLRPLLASQSSGTRVLIQVDNDIEVSRTAQAFRRAPVIELPSLVSRHQETRRILEETCGDVAIDLGAPILGDENDDIAALARRAYTKFSEVEEDARKLVAFRAWGVFHGAAKLGIDHGALSRWKKRWLASS